MDNGQFINEKVLDRTRVITFALPKERFFIARSDRSVDFNL